MKRSWLLSSAFGAAFSLVTVFMYQGPLGPLTSRIGYADNTGALMGVSVGACGTLGPAGTLGSRIVRTDANGALQVCGVTGGVGGDVSTDTIWDAAGDLVIGTGANTAARLARGTALQVLETNAAGTTLAWASVSGTGSVARTTSPTFVTPTLGVASGTDLTLTGSLTLPDNVRVTFNPGATVAGMNVGAQTSDPGTPVNGDLFYDSDDNLLRARINGAWVNLASGSLAAGDIDTCAEWAAIINAETGTCGTFVLSAGPTFTGTVSLAALTVSGVITLPDNERVTFNPGATVAGLNVGAQTADPNTPVNGDLFYDSDDNLLRARISGAWVNLGAAGSLSSTDIDTSAELDAIVTDDTGSGFLVFATSPTLVTPVLGVATATSVAVDTEVYDDAGWNADLTVPTKDAVRDLIASLLTLTDPNVDCVLEFDDSGGVIECAEAATLLTAANAITGAVNWSGITSLRIPASATPDLSSAGMVGLDTDRYSAAVGALGYYDGTTVRYLCGGSDAPSDGEVLKWHTSGACTWDADSTGSGSLGSNLTSTTNDITTNNSIIQLVGGSEALVLTFSSNTATFSTSTGITTVNFGAIAVRNAGLKGTIQLILGVCQGSTASLGMNIQASGAATVACAGSTIIHAVTTFADAATAEVQFQFRIPDDWDGADIELRSQWRTSATANNAIFQVSGVCGGDAEVIPTAYSSTADTVTETAKGTTLQMNDFAISLSVAANHALATCAAGETFYGRFFRDPSGSDTLATDVTITAPLTFYYGKL